MTALTTLAGLPVGTFFINYETDGPHFALFEITDGIVWRHFSTSYEAGPGGKIDAFDRAWWLQHYNARIIDDDTACKLLAMVALGVDLTAEIERLKT